MAKLNNEEKQALSGLVSKLMEDDPEPVNAVRQRPNLLLNDTVQELRSMGAKITRNDVTGMMSGLRLIQWHKGAWIPTKKGIRAGFVEGKESENGSLLSTQVKYTPICRDFLFAVTQND